MLQNLFSSGIGLLLLFLPETCSFLKMGIKFDETIMIRNNIRPLKNINKIISSSGAAAAVILSITISNPSATVASVEGQITEVAGTLVRTSPASTTLTAVDLLKSDINFNKGELQDMLFVFEKFEDIVSNRDYDLIRSTLRQEPLRTLRKTCKTLEKYLPSKDVQDKFEASYSKMIDAVDDLDYFASKRIRKEDIPMENKPDTEILNSLKKVISNLNDMINVASL